MIYLDTSVVLAQLLATDRVPPPALWHESLIASRLLCYEVWNRINAKNLAQSHGDLARDLLGRIAFVEMLPAVLERALDPFVFPARTLNALHIATIEFLRSRRQRVQLATYDRALAGAARSVGITLYNLP